MLLSLIRGNLSFGHKYFPLISLLLKQLGIFPRDKSFREKYSLIFTHYISVVA